MNKLSADPLETPSAIGVAQQTQIVPGWRRSGSGSDQVRVLSGRAVTILTVDLDGRRDLAVYVSIPMAVLGEVTVGAVHADIEVYRRHQHRFVLVTLCKFLWVVVGYDIAIRIKQSPLAIPFEDRPEIPAVTVIVRELCVVQLWIQIGDVTQEIEIGPLAPR